MRSLAQVSVDPDWDDDPQYIEGLQRHVRGHGSIDSLPIYAHAFDNSLPNDPRKPHEMRPGKPMSPQKRFYFGTRDTALRPGFRFLYLGADAMEGMRGKLLTCLRIGQLPGYRGVGAVQVAWFEWAGNPNGAVLDSSVRVVGFALPVPYELAYA